MLSTFPIIRLLRKVWLRMMFGSIPLLLMKGRELERVKRVKDMAGVIVN